METMAKMYNAFYLKEGDPVQNIRKAMEINKCNIECTVKDIIEPGDGLGKFPSASFEYQIIIADYENYISRLISGASNFEGNVDI